MYRSLLVDVDFTDQQTGEKVVKNMGLQRCLSAQVFFGTSGKHLRRNVPAKMAWIALNLRVMAWAYNSAMSIAGKPSVSGSGHEMEAIGMSGLVPSGD